MKEYFYQSGNKFFFNCYGGMNALINLAYFEFPRRLVYQAVDSRLVTWDEEEYIFEYDPSLVTDEEKAAALAKATNRSEEHTSELQSLMRISYAVFCLKK